MPEGPEARVFADDLNDLLQGEEILTVKYLSSAKIYHLDHVTFPATIKRVFAYGKKVIFDLSAFYMICSLGMTGKWLLKKDQHSHVSFKISQNKNKTNSNKVKKKNYRKIFFSDLRRFGNLSFYSPSEFKNEINSLGPCLMTAMPSEEDWLDIFAQRPRKNICAFLMDQNILAGIGNYLKADILFSCRISPDEKVKNLTDEQKLSIRKYAQIIMTESYQSQGNTIQSYKSVNGQEGFYQTRVYNRKTVQGYGVVVKKTPDGRKTHYVPELQIKNSERN